MGRRKKITTEEEVQDQPLEASRAGGSPMVEQWLADMATRPEVAVVRIAKRQPTGRWTWLRPYDLLPPFVADLTEMFSVWGDGRYRFCAMTSDGRFVTSHEEDVSGYGPQKVTSHIGVGPAAAAAKATEAQEEAGPPPEYEVSLRDLIQMERERLVLESLRRARGEAPPGAGGSDMERLASVVASMTQAMASAFAPLAQMMAGKMDSTARLLEAVLPRLTQEPQPIDRLIEAMSKVLDLRERLPEHEGGGWDEYLRPVLAVVTAQLAQRLGTPPGGAAAVNGALPGVMAGAPVAGSPPAAPAAPPAPAGAPVAATSDVLPGWIVAAMVDAARRGDTDWDLWCDVLEHRAPGVLQLWAQMPEATWVQALAQAVPELADPSVQTWLRGLHAAAVRSEVSANAPSNGDAKGP